MSAGAGPSFERVEELFAEVVDLDPEARRARLDACDDDAVRAEVESLLESSAGAGDRLRGAMAGAARSVVDDLAEHQVGRLIGPWRILAILGQGGMGTVYRARRDDGQFRREVALKVLQYGFSSQSVVSRFRDERQILASLQHPDIVKLLDGGTTDEGLPYIVMELVDGVALEVFARGRSVRERVALLARVCPALQYAHQQLVVHRDVKPSNILVDASGAPKLLDFGIAKLLEATGGNNREARTRTGIALLTPEYASPEQARGEVVSVASDVYGLGAVLYHLLVGVAPQVGSDDALQTLRNICEVEARRPSTVAPEADRKALAGDLDNIVMKALQKDPARRYPSVAALAEDLGRYLDGRPVLARDATFGYRATKFVRRHKGALAIAFAIAAALVIATIVSLMQAERADAAAEEALRRNRELLAEQGRQAFADDDAGRGLAYLTEAWRLGEDTPAVRFLVAEGERLYGREKMRIRDMPQGIANIVWMPDGEHILACGQGGKVRIYDGTSGAITTRLDVEPEHAIDACVASSDGAFVAANAPNGRVWAWDVAKGTLLWARGERPVEAVSVWSGATLATSIGGGRVVTCGQGRPPLVLDLATGAKVFELTSDHYAEHTCIITHDGRRLFVSQERRVVELDAATGAFVREVIGANEVASDPLGNGNEGAIGYFQSASDDARLFVALARRIWIWDVAAARMVAVVAGHSGTIGMRLSADEKLVVIPSAYSGVAIVSASDGRTVGELPHRGDANLRDASFDRSGRRIVTTSHDGTFRVLDAAVGGLELTLPIPVVAGTAPRSSTEAYSATFARDGVRVLSHVGAQAVVWSADRAPLLADLHTNGGVIGGALAPSRDRFVAVGFLRQAEVRALDGALLASLDVGNARLWDAAWSTRDVIGVAGDEAYAALLAPDGKLVRRLEGHKGTINGIRFRPDGATVATAGDDGTLRLWDVASGEERMSLPHPDRVSAVAWSRDGTRLASAGWEGTLRVWDPIDGQLVIAIPHPTPFLSVAFTPDGSALSAGGRGGVAGLWDIATGARRRAFEGHTGPVTAVLVSPDGALVASIGTDLHVRVWDPTTGLELGSRMHITEMLSGEWLDADRFVTFGGDARVRIWDMRRASGTAEDALAFVREHVPWRLVGGHVERVQLP